MSRSHWGLNLNVRVSMEDFFLVKIKKIKDLQLFKK
jgi:hypothetical protein